MTLTAVFITLVFAYSLVSKKLEQTILTAPILFTAAGMMVFYFLASVPSRDEGAEILLRLAEFGLVFLLFTDASRTELGVLRRIRNLPARLLSVGMLLTIALGAVAALAVFGRISIWEAGILAAILAPTDAGLGQIIVNSERVPLRIRQALNVEAGLNDGLSVPFMLFFFALAAEGAGSEPVRLSQFIWEQLGLGILVAAGIGLPGGWLLGLAGRKGWMAGSLQQLGVVALPILCVIAAEHVAASMFIAAFVAGLMVQVKFREAGRHSVEFTEQWGQLINLSVFFMFGTLIAAAWRQFQWTHWVYAIVSLTIVRMLPVAISLMGARLSSATILFMGWFGPRGLASIVLGLFYLEQESRLPGEDTIRLAVMTTVWLSILVHGTSALPGIQLYARTISDLPASAPEHREI
jgi:NhaP-type Na+/H+ or K+/H+ antiporter